MGSFFLFLFLIWLSCPSFALPGFVRFQVLQQKKGGKERKGEYEKENAESRMS
jgi:hypothetical protein